MSFKRTSQTLAETQVQTEGENAARYDLKFEGVLKNYYELKSHSTCFVVSSRDKDPDEGSRQESRRVAFSEAIEGIRYSLCTYDAYNFCPLAVSDAFHLLPQPARF